MILIFKDKKITEAAHSNVWIIKKKKIITHPANNEILKGVTRTVLISLIKSSNLDLIEREFTIKELYNSDEIFITNSVHGIVPINKVEETKFYSFVISTQLQKVLISSF